MKYIDELLFPGDYSEFDIQEAIKKNSNVLFPGCKWINPRNIDNGWLPDLFYAGIGNQYVVIGELKGSPPANKFSDALDQLMDYVDRFAVWYPRVPAKAILYGPWDKSEHTLTSYYASSDGIGAERLMYINIKKLGRWLAQRGNSNIMRKTISDMPYCYIPPTPLELAAMEEMIEETA